MRSSNFRRGLRATWNSREYAPVALQDAILLRCYTPKRLLVMAKVIREGYFEHGGYCFGRTHCWYAGDLSATIRRHQLDFLRLGGAALRHADHHLRFRALFRD